MSLRAPDESHPLTTPTMSNLRQHPAMIAAEVTNALSSKGPTQTMLDVPSKEPEDRHDTSSCCPYFTGCNVGEASVQSGPKVTSSERPSSSPSTGQAPRATVVQLQRNDSSRSTGYAPRKTGVRSQRNILGCLNISQLEKRSNTPRPLNQPVRNN